MWNNQRKQLMKIMNHLKLARYLYPIMPSSANQIRSRINFLRTNCYQQNSNIRILFWFRLVFLLFVSAVNQISNNVCIYIMIIFRFFFALCNQKNTKLMDLVFFLGKYGKYYPKGKPWKLKMNFSSQLKNSLTVDRSIFW